MRRGFRVGAIAFLAGSVIASGAIIPVEAVGASSQSASTDITARPDPVSAVLTARVEQHRVLIESYDTASTSTYANPDGTFTTESSSAPFRMRDASGNWSPISTTLETVDSHIGTLGVNPLGVQLASSLSSKTSSLVSLDVAGGSFSMRPLGRVSEPNGVSDWTAPTAGVQTAAAQIGQDLTPSQVLRGGPNTFTGLGNDVVYPTSVSGATLQYSLGSTALSESLILPSAASVGSGEWRYEISAPGYTETIEPDGLIEFVQDGKPSIVLPQSIAYDSSSATASTQVHMDLHVVGAGHWLLDTWVDQTWLESASRVWPIVVDPTVNVSNPPGWNYRADGSHASVTYGHGAYAGNPNSGSSNYWRSILAYSSSGFNGTGVNIDSVTLTVGLSAGTSNCYSIGAHTPNVGSYAGADYGSAVTSVGLCSANATMPSTSSLVNWVQSAANSQIAVQIGLVGSENSGAYTLKEMTSTLNVTYDTTPTVPSNLITSDSGNCTAAPSSGGTAYVNTAFPVLCATSTDPDSGANISFGMYIENSSNVVVATWTSYSVSSGSQVATQPPNSLPDGSYKWQAYATNGQHPSARSAFTPFIIDTQVPSSGIACSSTNPMITQTGQTIDESQVPSGGIALTCTFTGGDANVGTYYYQFDNGTQQSVAASGNAGNDFATTESFTIPQGTTGEGLQSVSMYASNLAGTSNSSSPSLWTLDVGYGMSQPFSGAQSSTTVPISAVAPTGTPSTTTAEVCWKYATVTVATNSCGTGWTNASTSVNVASSGSAWTTTSTGPVQTSPTGSGVITPIPSSGYTNPYAAPSLLLNLQQASIPGPQLIDVEVCFITSGTTTCAPAQPFDVLAHGFGSSMATRLIGPGSLTLGSGEYEIDATDASLTGYFDRATVTRSYTSMSAGASNGLGPDWTLNTPGGQSLINYQVVDNTVGIKTDGTISLVAANGNQLVFQESSSQSGHPADGASYTLSGIGEAGAQQMEATLSGQTQIFGGKEVYGLQVTDSSGTTTDWLSTAQPTGAPANFGIANYVQEPQSSGGSVDTWMYDPNAGTQLDAVSAAMPSSSNCPTSFATLPVTQQELSGIGQGCRVMSFNYASTTTATAAPRTGTSGYGSYTGQLGEIDLTQWDPNAHGGQGAILTLPVQCYLYDSGGYLREVWDPRAGVNYGSTTSCSSTPVLPTLYLYTANATVSGVYPLASVTPPGLNAASFSYDSSGRLTSISQALDSSDTTGGTTASTTIAYGVSIGGGGSTGLPSLTNPSSWSQTIDVPITGVAIFPPDHVPTGSPGASDWPHAQITYLDGLGRAVDVASYGDGAWNGTAVGSGWNIDAQQYGQVENSGAFNSQDNIVWSLSANGYEAAMAAGGSNSATTAQEWASLSFYNSTTANGVPLGAELTDVYSPWHNIQTSSGVVAARSHTYYAYGLDSPGTYGTYTNGATFTHGPDGLPWQLVTVEDSGYSTTQDPTSLSDSQRSTDFAVTSLPDFRTTTNQWFPVVSGDGDPKLYGTPSEVTTAVTGSSSLTRILRLNSLGQVIEQDQPMSAGQGADQGGTITAYYSASGSGACNGIAQWAGLPCSQGPGSTATAPSVGSRVPVSTTTYDWALMPQSVVESVAGTSERTTTTTHDESGRVTATRIVDSVSGDLAVPDTVDLYSSSTGLPTGTDLVTGDTISGDTLGTSYSVTASVTTAYDQDGRPSSLTDANGATSYLTYNIDSQQVQETEPVNYVSGGVSICDSYGGTDANGNAEYRAVLTMEKILVGSSCTGSSPATFTAAYDGNADQVAVQYPNGMLASTTYDPASRATNLAYTQGGSGVGSGIGSNVMTFAQTYNAFGEAVSESGPGSNNQYAFDGAGRLTGVGEDSYTYSTSPTCFTRDYTLDGDSNRTSYQETTSSPSGGVCPTNATGSTVASAASTFDTNGTGQGGSDRIVQSTWGSNTGYYSYDVLGRVSLLPSVDTGFGGSSSAGNIYFSYRADDQISQICQGSSSSCSAQPTESLTYDPLGNVASITISNAASGSGLTNGTSTNYYDGSGSPAWMVNPGSTSTAFFAGPTAGNALDVTFGATASPSCLGDSTASCTINLSDMRGNVVATAAAASGTNSVSTYNESTEFGLPQPGGSFQASTSPYGWLGVAQRYEANLSGLALMGVRTYDPTTGAFQQPDPIFGGNANPYTYPTDPINGNDISGRGGHRGEMPPAEYRLMVYCGKHPNAGKCDFIGQFGQFLVGVGERLAVGVAIGLACGPADTVTLGLACIATVGAIASVGVKVADNYARGSKVPLLTAVLEGLIGASYKVGKSGAIFIGGKRFGWNVKTLLQLAKVIVRNDVSHGDG